MTLTPNPLPLTLTLPLTPNAFQEAVRTEMATVARQATAKRLLRGSIAPDGRSTRSLL